MTKPLRHIPVLIAILVVAACLGSKLPRPGPAPTVVKVYETTVIELDLASGTLLTATRRRRSATVTRAE